MMSREVFSTVSLEGFEEMAVRIAYAMLEAKCVETQSWQSQQLTESSPMAHSYEVTHARVEIPFYTADRDRVSLHTKANLPWAEDHFQERVSGEPLNPPPSEAWWPYAVQGNAAHKQGEKFSHTYPERFWPKYAGEPETWDIMADDSTVARQAKSNFGIRYRYGDLQDVINQLKKDFYTRQAYLPVWFPEDTGAVEGQRVPCTLGYHFLFREYLHIEYHIRSCDFIRHWRDDVYMAIRLCQWVAEKLGVRPGRLIMNIGSFHIFEGDREMLKDWAERTTAEAQQSRYNSIASAL